MRIEMDEFYLESTQSSDQIVEIDTAAIEMGIDGFEDQTSTLSVRYEHDGLDLSTLVFHREILSQLVASRMEIDIEMIQIPHSAIWQQFTSIVSQYPSSWMNPEFFSVFSTAVTQLLHSHQSQLLLNTFSFFRHFSR